MNKQKYIKKFCTGCGLCHSAQNIKIKTDERGFPIPIIEDGKDTIFYESVCPVFFYAKENQVDVWGHINDAIIGYSSNPEVRFRAASGGALTEICCYLLDEGIVDGIIHTTCDPDNQTKTISCISTTKEEVIKRAGSRYSISVPLADILQIIDYNKKYAFVGKPCDVMALREYMNSYGHLSGVILYLLSFFCAGEPSVKAQENLLKGVGCTFDELASITYRGNGWPGYTTIENRAGDISKLEYKDAWGKYLGRDLREICRFCLDGTGDAADIVCADFWYLDAEGNPDFSEHDGRNIIISRTEKGKDLLSATIESGKLICTEDYLDQMPDFYKYQPAQYKRKGTMSSMIFAMKVCGQMTPKYNKTLLSRYSKHLNKKVRLKYFMGTVKRVIKGKI